MGNQKIIKISRKKFKVTLIILLMLTILLGIVFMLNPLHQVGYQLDKNELTEILSYQESNTKERMDYQPNYNHLSKENPTIRDNREFIKTNYGAKINTRNVKNTMRDIKNVIRDTNGRIDRIDETAKYGRVNFAIPKSNFENFKNEVESITHEKLIEENISSENLLNQKQFIEEQHASAIVSLTELQKKQKDLVAKHNKILNKLQKDKNTYTNQLAQVRYTISVSPLVNGNPPYALREEENDLTQVISSLTQEINSENSNFDVNNQNIKTQINYVNTQVEKIKNQDIKFTENIETVNGSISVSWISFWKLIKIFSPIHPTIIIIIFILVIWYILNRTKILPKAELE